MKNDEFTWEGIVYRDKLGRVIQADELECLLRNKEYRIVKQDWIGKVLVSTVWLGIPFDMGISYFETMVFGDDEEDRELHIKRYENLWKAEKGHEEVLAEWKERLSQSDASQSTDHSTGRHSQES